MNMILNATDNRRLEPLIVGDASHVRPKLGLKLWLQTLLPLFRAEDHVNSIAE